MFGYLYASSNHFQYLRFYVWSKKIRYYLGGIAFGKLFGFRTLQNYIPKLRSKQHPSKLRIKSTVQTQIVSETS